MHFQMKERETAMQISRARELFYWLASFYAVSTVGLIGRFRTTKRPGTLAPIVPLSFVVAYYADLAYGTKIHRIQGKGIDVVFLWVPFNILYIIAFQRKRK